MKQKTNKIKFVVIQSEVLTQRWESYLHLDELAESFDVEFWDCSAIAVPNYISKEIERPYVKTILNKAQYKSELQKLPQDTLIVLNRIMFNKDNYDFLKTLAKRFPKQLDIDFFAGNQLMASLWSVAVSKEEEYQGTESTEKSNNAKSTSIFKSIKQLLYKSDAIYLLMKRIRYRNDNKGYKDVLEKYYFRKCGELFESHLISYQKNSAYPINPPDYEQYLKLGECIEEKEYIVFIDQAFPVHPEFKSSYEHIGIQSLAQEYYLSMRKFFDRVEQQTGLKVVVAGHPVANYKGDEYGEREIFYGKTAELVRDAKAVFIHTSHAINFPIFYQKPLVFLINSAWKKAIRHANHLAKVTEYFQKQPVNTDEEINIMQYLKPIQPDIRKKYLSDMIDKRTEGKYNADLLKEYLLQIHHEMYGGILR